MTSELEKTFFDTFGIEKILPCATCYYWYDNKDRCYWDYKNDTECKAPKVYPQITDRILLELICLNNIYLWETHASTVNELKNVLLNKYIEHVNLMADENEKQEYINQVRALFEEEK